MMMKFLLNIPLVISFAEWVWSDDDDNVSPKQCLESLVTSLLMSNTACWSRLLAKGFGIAIVLVACLNKAPVIRNILNSKSTAGIARYSVYGDCIVYANMAVYGIKEQHPFTAFGENIAILLQSLVIIILIYKFENKPIVSFMERFLVLLFGILYTLVVFLVLPNQYNYLLISSTWPMYISSRGSQIYHTAIVAKHTGAQSLITLSLNLLGNCVRIMTTIKEVGMDLTLLGAYLMGASINMILIGQYLYYQENTRVFLQQLQDEQQQQKKEKKA